MPGSASGSDDEIDERNEPTTWDDVEDTINDEEDPLDEVFFTTVGNEAGAEAKPIVVQEDFHKGKFVDPLGILRMPPRTFVGKPQSIDDETFDPVAQLAGLHISTNFSELVQGMRRLSRKLSSQEADIKQLVRDNFDRFISCKDVIDGIYERISENETSASGISTRQVEVTCKEVLSRAYRVYEPLLLRKAETDKIRQSLSVLSRFSFLFTLPSKIATNIRDGEYDKAVQHYKKAASIFQDQGAISRIPVFMHVFAEVENIVTAFRSTLYSALSDPSSSFEAQMRVIRILVDLARPSDFRLNPEKDPRDDPGWYYLNMAASRMIVRLSNGPPDSSLSSQPAASTAPTTATDAPAIHINNVLASSMMITQQAGGAGGGAAGGGSVYRSVRSACGHVARHLPNVWKMGQLYLEGRFDPRNDGPADRGKEEQQAHPQQQDKEKLDKAATVRVFFSDETTSVRVDSRKPCSELVELCLRRVEGDHSNSNYAIFTWIEKRRKKDGVKVIKITELGPSEKINKLHKKWGDKSGLSHKFLFKRKDEKFPRMVDPRTVVEDYTLEMRANSGTMKRGKGEEGKGGNKKKCEADFHQLITGVLTVFADRVETMFFQENGEDDFDADLAATSEDITDEWAFGKMRAQVLDVVTTLNILQKAGMNEKYLLPVSRLVLTLCGHYVSRVCGQWSAEVALLYLSVSPSEREPGIALDSSVGLPIVTSTEGHGGKEAKDHHLLPSLFVSTTKFYLTQFKGIVSKGHPLVTQIQSAFGEALKCFADTLHHLAFNVQEEEEDDYFESSTTKVHQQLRIVAQILETRNVVIGNLWSHFNELFKLVPTHQIEEEVLSSPLDVLRHLGNMTVARYIHDRITTFNRLIRNGIVLAPATEWAAAPIPTSVSEYAMSVLLQFVYVSSELSILDPGSENFRESRYSFEKPGKNGLLEGTPSEVITKLISALVWGMMEAFKRGLEQLDSSSISICGVYQLRLDFFFIESILSRYTTEHTTGISKAIHVLLSQMEDDVLQSGAGEEEIEVEIEEIIEDTSRRAVVLFASLTGDAELPATAKKVMSKFESSRKPSKSPLSAQITFGRDSKLADMMRKGRAGENGNNSNNSKDSNNNKSPSPVGYKREASKDTFFSLKDNQSLAPKLEKEEKEIGSRLPDKLSEREKIRERLKEREAKKEKEREKGRDREREKDGASTGSSSEAISKRDLEKEKQLQRQREKRAR